MKKASTTRTTFSRETTVSTLIPRSREKVWSVLTDASEFSRWTSTIKTLEGDIAKNGSIRMVSTLAPKRTFKLKVKEFRPNERLAWGDRMGTRIFELEEKGEETLFTMTETISTPLLPLIARMIPDFDASFNQFVSDLIDKCAAN